MPFVNLTPHALTLILPSGDRLVLQPAAPKGQEARVSSTPGTVSSVTFDGGVEMLAASPATPGPVVNLPPRTPGTVFLVSAMVGQHPDVAQGRRPDVWCPGTGPNDNPERDPETKQITGVTRLVQY